MNILQNRIDSFKNNTVKWPYADKQQYHKTETFAKAGFYFMRRPRTVDSVRCFMCDIDLGHWRPGQSPYTRHAMESPTCPWVLLNFPDAAASTNKALTVNEKDSTTQPQHKVMKAARLATFNHHHYWPPNKSLKSRRFQVASKLSDAGFYFTPTLESTSRIKCPYCKATIMEPDRTIDALALHRQLNDTCPFFGQQRKIGSSGSSSSKRRSRRDTTTSTASSDTYKTAESQLDPASLPPPPPPPPPPQAQAEEQDVMVPQKRKAEQEVEVEKEKEKEKEKKEDDDSIWDIQHFLNIPAHVKKPTLTYGNKSTERRTRKRTHVDIFSSLDLSSSPSLVVERSLEGSGGSTSISNSRPSRQTKKPSLIEKVDTPKPKRTRTTTPTTTSTKNNKEKTRKTKSTKEKKAPTPSPILPPANISKEQLAVASTSSFSLSRMPAPPTSQAQAQAQEPLPGVADNDESLLLSPVFPPPNPIILDKSLTAIPIQFNESKAKSATPPPPQSLESLVFSDENQDPVPHATTPTRDKGKQRQVEHAIVPKRTSLSLSKSIPNKPLPATTTMPISPSRNRNSDVAASLAKQYKQLQSTPMRNASSSRKVFSVTDIFGDCSLSPITTLITTGTAGAAATPNISQAAAHIRTPAIASTTLSSVDGVVGRTRSVFTADGQRRRLPLSSHHYDTSTTTTIPHVTSMTLNTDSTPPVTEEQKQMTVEAFVQHVVDENITKVRQQGERIIDTIREKSNRIKQDLLSQKQ